MREELGIESVTVYLGSEEFGLSKDGCMNIALRGSLVGLFFWACLDCIIHPESRAYDAHTIDRGYTAVGLNRLLPILGSGPLYQMQSIYHIPIAPGHPHARRCLRRFQPREAGGSATTRKYEAENAPHNTI